MMRLAHCPTIFFLSVYQLIEIELLSLSIDRSFTDSISITIFTDRDTISIFSIPDRTRSISDTITDRKELIVSVAQIDSISGLSDN